MELTYIPDILGDGFEQHQFEAKPDYEGRVVFTLIRKLCSTSTDKAVLYIHGFYDYFFQRELADKFNQQGYNFYAIDLRKCGRSILQHQTAYDTRKLNCYFGDLDVCLSVIRAEGNNALTILGHSTGGLIAACYLSQTANSLCKALVLNSPFLEMNKGGFIRNIGLPIVSFIARFYPKLKIKAGFSPFYGESLHLSKRGEWDYNLSWKPIVCGEITAGWLRAIRKGHRAVKRGLNIQCPVLVMSSDKSLKGREWRNEFYSCDLVLNVEHIQLYADRLGKKVSKLTIANGMHDLILSCESVRSEMYKKMFCWLNELL